MRYKQYWLTVICYILFLFPGTVFPESDSEIPLLKKGVIDLRSWDFSQSGPVNLGGEWEFYWQEFLVSNGHQASQKNHDGYVTVPNNWQNYELDSGIKPSSTGFGSYRIKIQFPNQKSSYRFYLRQATTAHRLYLLDSNGKVQNLGGSGKPGSNEESSKPSLLPYTTDFEASGDIELIWEVSNYHHVFGGMRFTPVLGLGFQVEAHAGLNLNYLVLGAILIVCIFNLLLFLFQREEKASAWLGVSGLFVSVLMIIEKGMFYHPFKPYDGSLLLYQINAKLLFISIAAIAPTIVGYISSISSGDSIEQFRTKLYTSFKTFIHVSSGTYIFLIIVLPVRVSTSLLPFYYIILSLGFSWAVYHFALLVRQKNDTYTVISFLGFVVLFLTFVNDALHAMKFISTSFILYHGYLVLMIIQAFVTSHISAKSKRQSIEYSKTIEKQSEVLKSLNINLEQEVRKRTVQQMKAEAMNRSLLEQSPDRIIAIDSNFSILYCNKPLGDDHRLVGKPIFSVISPSVIEFIHDALEEAFSTGSSNMLEIHSDMSGTSQWFEYRFAGISDEAGDINEVMLIITNITKRKTAEIELEEVQKQLMDKAHRAGMADIAADMLHNVGNYLNSLKLSAEVALSLVQESNGIEGLLDANKFVRDIDNVKAFLKTDPKAPDLLEYYLILEKSIIRDREKVTSNLKDVINAVKEITKTVNSQRSLIGDEFYTEKTDIGTIIEEALLIKIELIKKNSVKVEKSIEDLPMGQFQKLKLISVLVNLFENAVEAMLETPINEKLLQVKVYAEESTIVLKIEDSGIGIASSDLSKIFSRGYSTKPKNYGFGLHDCANYVAEMKGEIWAESEGENRGASLYIRLPFLTN